MKKYRYILEGLDCASCAREVEEHLEKDQYLKNVRVNFSTLNLSFETDKEGDVFSYVKKLIQEVEPEVRLREKSDKYTNSNSLKFNLLRLIIGVIFAILGCSNILPNTISSILIILAYIILLARTMSNAVKLLLSSKSINESFLITISCIGAYLIGEKVEGLMVIILYEIGKILEEKAINNSRKSIAELMDIKPEEACLENGKVVSPSEVKINDIILIKVGEKVPLDGIVVSGESYLDTSSLIGESKPFYIKQGDKIMSGSINKEGIIKVKVTEKYEDSTVNKILELVQNATDKKAKTENFVSKASKIYTPIVISLSLIVGFLLPVFTNVTYQVSIYRALIFLVISCPCAIAISVPLSYFSGIGKASKEGILIKGSDYLDILKDIDEIVFDKTGTLTTGEFGVTDVIVMDKNYQKSDVVEYAVKGEVFSNHPISKSIISYYNKKVDTSKVENHKEVAGKGITYTEEGKHIKIGNALFTNYQGELKNGTNVFVRIDKKIIGCIILNDILKSDTKKGIELLQKRNVKTKMFTGDNKISAISIMNELGLSEIKYEMMPDDKYNELEKIIKSKTGDKKTAYVGDGINDSPVLALADVGISMGGLGTSAAIEASDVVIMTDSIVKIDTAIAISKFTDKIIKENLSFAIAVKIIILILSLFGASSMVEAIFADVGVTIITIFNTLRILNYKSRIY